MEKFRVGGRGEGQIGRRGAPLCQVLTTWGNIGQHRDPWAGEGEGRRGSQRDLRLSEAGCQTDAQQDEEEG